MECKPGQYVDNNLCLYCRDGQYLEDGICKRKFTAEIREFVNVYLIVDDVSILRMKPI